MRAQRYQLKNRFGWLALPIYAAAVVVFGALSIATSDAPYVLYALGGVALTALTQRFIEWRYMFIEFGPEQVRVRQGRVGARAAYSLIDSIGVDSDSGKVSIDYRLLLAEGKNTSYQFHHSFWPKDFDEVVNELRQRVNVAKVGRSEAGKT